jgi:hypothetical protein
MPPGIPTLDQFAARLELMMPDQDCPWENGDKQRKSEIRGNTILRCMSYLVSVSSFATEPTE